jgi:TPR repeat protein
MIRCLATLLVAIFSAHAAVAQNHNAYDRGQGAILEDNYAEAIKWYRIAADQGDARAQYALGAMNDGGVGMSQNYAEAIKWWRRSADQGYTMAQWSLGLAYAYGEEVAQDFVRAHMWLNLAASATVSVYYSSTIRANAAEQRILVARKMTLAQVTEAQKLASEWKPKLER